MRYKRLKTECYTSDGFLVSEGEQEASGEISVVAIIIELL